MSNRQIFVPIFLQTELERLASAIGVDFNISDDSGESEYLYFMEQLVSKAERSEKSIDELKERLRQRTTEPNRNSYSTSLSAKEQKLLKQAQGFEEEIQGEIEKADEGLGYAEKINRLHQKFQKEKDQRKVLESFIQAQNKKIKVLIDHVEKLMKAIKIESNKRMTIIEEGRRMTVEQNTIQLRSDKQMRINSLQHRTIQELREGSKVLEDQLRLMDEKYLELKSKFDLAREQFGRKYKKMSKENDDMKVYIRMNMGVRATMTFSSNNGFPSSPPSPVADGNLHIHIPGNNFGTPFGSNQLGGVPSTPNAVAVGSAMNSVLQKKAAASAASGHDSKNMKIPEPISTSATNMSATFLQGLSRQSPMSPSHDMGNTLYRVGTSDSSPRAKNDVYMHDRPNSAASPVARRTDYYDVSQRPKSSNYTANRKQTRKALNHVMDKITKHSGKKSLWSAERLSSLLED